MLGDVSLDGARWRIGRVSFRRPNRILTTTAVGDVESCIRSAEEAARAGAWVVGYVSYDAAPGFDSRLRTPGVATSPLVWFGVYDHPDEASQASHTNPNVGRWAPSMSPEEHDRAVASIRSSIEAGDTYQANLTFRLDAAFSGEVGGLFRRMVAEQRHAYAALLDLGDSQVISVSPELFIAGTGRRVETRPMKGTAPRGRTYKEDEARRTDLVASKKEQAGNIMIVDLVRNDLGRVSETGSIVVPKLFETERHPTLWQLTSTIESDLRDDVGLFELLAATFPSGSVTGAPKISTMDIIADIETVPRGVYCGTIGYLEPGADRFEFSVAIRTAVIAGGMIGYHVGGGITYDSLAGAEYEECLWKALVVTSQTRVPALLETMLYSPDIGIALLPGHLRRLSESAAFWGIPFDLEKVGEALSGVGGHHRVKVRLLLAPSGEIEVELHRAEVAVQPVQLQLSATRIDPSDPLWYHKTADRSRYPEPLEDGHEWVLTNLDGHVTETSISNLVLRIGDVLVTPPVQSGCLPGVFRQSLIDSGAVVEREVALEDLKLADELAVVNAVRGYRKAILID